MPGASGPSRAARATAETQMLKTATLGDPRFITLG